MRKLFIIFIALTLFGRVFGEITTKEQNHKNIAQSNKNDIEVNYHSNHYDLLYSGTNKWAVRFDFSEYFSNAENSLPIFRPKKLKIFSSGEETVSLNILGGNSTTPNDTVFATYENQTLVSGWNTIQLPVNLELRNIYWVVISSDIFIDAPASYGDGAHSYYWVQTTTTDGYFANMQAYNFHSELLFTFEGDFTSSVHNINFKEFKYIKDENNPQNYSPKIKIVNNGMNPVSDIKVDITINSSAPDFNPYVRELSFPGELVAGDSLFINCPDSLNVLFSQDYSQYEINALLTCDDTLDFAYDNSQEYSQNVFPFEQNKFLLENFMLSTDQTNSELWNFQNSFNLPETFLINYFPISYDIPYYNSESLNRFNFYSCESYPTTLINGVWKLVQFNENYQNNFQIYLDSLNTETTFIREQENSGTYFDDGRMEFKPIIINNETYLFSNFASGLRFYAALVMNNFDENISENFFIGFLTDQTGENITLNHGESGEINLQWNKSDFDLIDYEQWNDCKIIYWVQNSEKIYFVNSINIADFEHSVNNGDENLPMISLKTGPNPFNPEISKYKIMFKNKIENNAKIQIFNIKGQLIKTLNCNKEKSSMLWDGKNSHNSYCASGIYLIKIFNNKKIITKKVMLIK